MTGVSRRGQVHAGQRDPLPRARAARSTSAREVPGQAQGDLGHRAPRQGDRHRPAAHRPHAALATRRRTPRCSTAIREVFAQTPEARAFGYTPGRFSFNVKGGRCEACEGDGVKLVEMHFLADVYVPCEVCGGKRFNDATLRVRYKGKNIAEVLDMSVREAMEHFARAPGHHARAARRWTTWGSGTSSSASPRPRCPAARRSASSSSRELAQVATPAARSTSSTSRPRACTSRTSASCCSVLNRLVEAGNTVRGHRAQPRRHQERGLGDRPRAPRAATRAAGSSPPGRPSRWRRSKASYTGQYLGKVLTRGRAA